MSQPSKLIGRRVLVIGAQGVLGALLVRGFEHAGWKVTRGGRRPDERSDFLHVDLDEPETVSTAIGHADVVLNPVPDDELVAERMVLDQGGLLINVSAMPAAAGRRLRQESTTTRGTVVMNAGIAPGVTNLIAADLLAVHPEADEVELAFTVSTRSTSGRAGGDFAHRNVTTVPRHRTAVIPLPEPFGTRRCLGFAEPDAGWLGELPTQVVNG
jgi:NAD(P)-dependent dehydrogenase (short-subunit alcohol dehydrogenase family)